MKTPYDIALDAAHQAMTEWEQLLAKAWHSLPEEREALRPEVERLKAISDEKIRLLKIEYGKLYPREIIQ